MRGHVRPVPVIVNGQGETSPVVHKTYAELGPDGHPAPVSGRGVCHDPQHLETLLEAHPELGILRPIGV